MKILLTSHQFFPEHSAGTEVLTYKVAKELQRQGHQVILFTATPTKKPLSDSMRFDRYEYDGIPIDRFFHQFSPDGGQSNIMEMEYDSDLVATYFRKLLARERPDIVHFFHLGRISSSPIPECHKCDIPAFYTPTDFWGVCPTNQLRLPCGKLCNGPDRLAINCVQHLAAYHPSPLSKLASQLPRFMLAPIVFLLNRGVARSNRYADLVRAISKRRNIVVSRLNSIEALLAPSRLMEKTLEANGVDKNKIHFFPYGLDLNLAHKPRQHQKADQLRVGFIGTLAEHKGSHVLIEALNLIPDLDVELSIFGSALDYPHYYNRLCDLANGSPRIKFCGTFPNNEIGDIFSRLDVLVVPSIWYENTPLVIYTAQACGCPVIASRLGGMTEVIHHEINGLVFEAGNSKEIALAIERLHLDRELLNRLSENCSEPRSIANYTSDLIDMYSASLIARRR